MKKCPQCGSKKVHRSHVKGRKEIILKLFFRRPYRCLSCGWRGIARYSLSLTRFAPKYSIQHIVLIIIIAAITIIIVLWLIAREPAKIEPALQAGVLNEQFAAARHRL